MTHIRTDLVADFLEVFLNRNAESAMEVNFSPSEKMASTKS